MGWYGIKLPDPIPSGNGMVSISKHALSLYKQCANSIRYALAILGLICHQDPIPFRWDGMDPPPSHTIVWYGTCWDGISHTFPTTIYDQTESDFCGTSKQITANSSYYNEKSASQYNEQTSGEKTTLLTISE